mmetsp:Transcript_29279/g.68820  ORF Transcript_29279/g.68820 Transcript_29279/m.68820 type:complete len:242 (-) Transcript_29279:298-1023(-)
MKNETKTGSFASASRTKASLRGVAFGGAGRGGARDILQKRVRPSRDGSVSCRTASRKIEAIAAVLHPPRFAARRFGQSIWQRSRRRQLRRSSRIRLRACVTRNALNCTRPPRSRFCRLCRLSRDIAFRLEQQLVSRFSRAGHRSFNSLKLCVNPTSRRRRLFDSRFNEWTPEHFTVMRVFRAGEFLTTFSIWVSESRMQYVRSSAVRFGLSNLERLVKHNPPAKLAWVSFGKEPTGFDSFV